MAPSARAHSQRGVVSIHLSFASRLLMPSNGPPRFMPMPIRARAWQNGRVVVFLSALNPQDQDVNGLLSHGTRRNQHMEPGAAACEELIGRPIHIASLAAVAFRRLQLCERSHHVEASLHRLDSPRSSDPKSIAKNCAVQHMCN